jgi:hypothetical protein
MRNAITVEKTDIAAVRSLAEALAKFVAACDKQVGDLMPRG